MSTFKNLIIMSALFVAATPVYAGHGGYRSDINPYCVMHNTDGYHRYLTVDPHFYWRSRNDGYTYNTESSHFYDEDLETVYYDYTISGYNSGYKILFVGAISKKFNPQISKRLIEDRRKEIVDTIKENNRISSMVRVRGHRSHSNLTYSLNAIVDLTADYKDPNGPRLAFVDAQYCDRKPYKTTKPLCVGRVILGTIFGQETSGCPSEGNISQPLW